MGEEFMSLFLVHAQTVEPITMKLGLEIDEALDYKINAFSYNEGHN